jgi:hypothetical protein
MNGSEFLPPLILRTDLLRRGDVLLTRGGEKDSALIARLSDGPFSHAALVVNKAMTFESDGGLIGHRPISLLGLGEVAGQFRPLGRIPGEAKDGAVYRHPLMEKVPKDEFRTALAAQMGESYGKDYSELYRLVQLSNLPPQVQPLLASFVRLFENEEKIAGPFCSELVARFFARLGLSLFDPDRPPEQVSPNALATSNLVLVEGAAVFSDGVRIREARKDIAAKLDEMLPMPATSVSMFRNGVDVFSEEWQLSRRIERAVTQLDGSMNDFVLSSKASVALKFHEEIRVVARLVEATATVNRPQEAWRVAQVVRSCLDLEPDIVALANPGSMAVDRANTILDRWHSFHRSLLRCVTLCASERLKDRANSDDQRSVFERWQIRGQRKRLVVAARRALLDEPSTRRPNR